MLKDLFFKYKIYFTMTVDVMIKGGAQNDFFYMMRWPIQIHYQMKIHLSKSNSAGFFPPSPHLCTKGPGMYQQQPVIYIRAVLTLIRILGAWKLENIQKHELVLCALLTRALLPCIPPTAPHRHSLTPVNMEEFQTSKFCD